MKLCGWVMLLIAPMYPETGAYSFSRYLLSNVLPCTLSCFVKNHRNVHGYYKFEFHLAATPDWMNRPDDRVVQIPDNTQMEQLPLFDALYNSETDETIDDTEHSISQMSVKEISEAYQFSISFLGDFMIQLGCREPLDVDSRISNLLTGEQIFSLLNALTTLDAYESNAGYDSMSLGELAESLDVTKDRILRIAKKEELNLPFGLDTVLHVSLVDKIRNGVQYDEYDGIDDCDDYIPSGASDEFMDVEFTEQQSEDIRDDNFGDEGGFYELQR